MPEGDRAHAGGRRLRRGTASVVVLVLLAALASYQFDLGRRWFGAEHPSPVTEPAQVLPPAGLTLPTAHRAAPVAATTPEGGVDGNAVRRAVASLVASPKLGPHVVVEVAQLSNGAVVYRHGTGQVTPASTMKLLTTSAAMQVLGADHRFVTSVVATPASKRIVLVGGGDPLLVQSPSDDEGYPARADLETLAHSTARSLKALGRSKVQLGYDTTLFTGPPVNPRWEPSYIPDDVVSPITPLWVDEGRVRPGLAYRSRTPSSTAARLFAQDLARRGITVIGPPTSMKAPGRKAGARPIAKVRSAPLAEVVQHILEVSDNEGAEVLSRQVAVAEGRPASSAGGAAAVRAVLKRIGISTAGDQIYDGSGLSRDDRLDPGTLLSVIRTASGARRAELRPVVANLPVAGFTGSLASRFDTGSTFGLGTVRAKTGTLTGVHGLAGTVTSKDGAVMAFVAIADKVRPINTLTARTRIDELAAALGACACRASGAGRE